MENGDEVIYQRWIRSGFAQIPPPEATKLVKQCSLNYAGATHPETEDLDSEIGDALEYTEAARNPQDGGR